MHNMHIVYGCGHKLFDFNHIPFLLYCQMGNLTICSSASEANVKYMYK